MTPEEKKFRKNLKKRIAYWEREVCYWSENGLGHWPSKFMHAYDMLQREYETGWQCGLFKEEK